GRSRPSAAGRRLAAIAPASLTVAQALPAYSLRVVEEVHCMTLSRRAFVSLPLAAAFAGKVSAQESGIVRPYWPTKQWSRSRPERQGMDPALLDQAGGTGATPDPDGAGPVGS